MSASSDKHKSGAAREQGKPTAQARLLFCSSKSSRDEPQYTHLLRFNVAHCHLLVKKTKQPTTVNFGRDESASGIVEMTKNNLTDSISPDTECNRTLLRINRLLRVF